MSVTDRKGFPGFRYLALVLTGVILCTMQACVSNPASTPALATPMPPSTAVFAPLTSHTVVPEATQQATPTLQNPTSTPTATMQPRREATATLPFSTESEFRFDAFFLAGLDDSCKLPCWYGLIPEQSNKEQVEAKFFELFSDYPIITVSSREDTLFMTQIWKDPDDRNLFVVRAYVNPKTQKLIGIELSWSLGFVENFNITMSPQLLLRKLGEPEEVLIDVSPFVGEEEAIIDAIFHWENGVGYRYTRWSEMSNERTVQLCLNYRSESTSDFLIDQLFIFSDDEGLTRINRSTREKLFGENLDLSDMDSLQTVFGISTSGLASVAQEQSVLCLTSESVPLFRQ